MVNISIIAKDLTIRGEKDNIQLRNYVENLTTESRNCNQTLSVGVDLETRNREDEMDFQLRILTWDTNLMSASPITKRKK